MSKRRRLESGDGVQVSIEPQLETSIMEYGGDGQETYRHDDEGRRQFEVINRLDFGVDTGHDAELAAKDERADGGKYPSAETSMRMQLSGHITHALNEVHIVGQILKDTIQKKRLEFVTVEDSGQSTIDVPHQYAFQRRSLTLVHEKFRTGTQQVKEAAASTVDYITQLSLLAKRWRVRWSGPAPICEFDFRSAGSTFHNRGEAEVVETPSPETGALRLTIDVPRRLETVVEVNCSIGQNTQPASSVKLIALRLEPAPVSSWELQLMQAQESLFAQELFVTLNREANRVPWAHASVATGCLKLAVRNLPPLNISLDTVGRIGGTDDSGAAQKVTAVCTGKEPQERLIALAAKMLLRNQHRHNNPGHHTGLRRRDQGTLQRREPPMILRQTVTLHTCRQSVQAVGKILHDVAREVALRTPNRRMVPHYHVAGPNQQHGFTVDVHTRARTGCLPGIPCKSFVLLVNGTGVDVNNSQWISASDPTLKHAIVALVSAT